jgi:hypothetical protein
MQSTQLSALSRPFDPGDIAWKPVATSPDRTTARVVPYVTNRAIMDRLDLVCGPEGWRNEFRPGPNGGLLCGLSVRVVREDGPAEWITKWDGADNTDVQPVKGGLSASMRRAAVPWGIGRYLYRVPPVYARIDEKGRLAERPRLPDAVAEARVDPAPKRPAPVRVLPRPVNGRTVAA